MASSSAVAADVMPAAMRVDVSAGIVLPEAHGALSIHRFTWSPNDDYETLIDAA